MSDAALSALVSSLASKQLSKGALGVQVDNARKRTAQALRSVAAVKEAAKLDNVSRVSREILDLDVPLEPKAQAALRQSSEAGQARAKGSAHRWAELVKLEAARHRVVRQLASNFAKLAGERLGRKWHAHFEDWLFARRHAEGGGSDGADDAVLPSTQLDGVLTDADFELRRKLVAAGEDEGAADAICLELGRLTGRLKARLPSASAKAVKVKVARLTGPEGKLDKLRLTWEGVSVEVNREHYDKLRVLFQRAHRSTPQLAADSTAFTHAAMALLLRYSSLQGTHHLGGSFQAAVHGDVFDALKAGFDTCMECFASPLNCRWPSFCSAFLETDAAFGSLGSFFRFRPRRGSFQVNPPFDKAFVTRVAKHLHSLLSSTQEDLMFVVIIPAWEGDPSWEAIRASPFQRSHLMLSAGEHGYFVGAQHSRSTRYHVASTATSVFFLQSPAAATRWPVTQAKLDAIEAAFAPRSSTFSNVKARSGRGGESAGACDALLAGDFNAEAARATLKGSSKGRLKNVEIASAGPGTTDESETDDDGGVPDDFTDAGADALGAFGGGGSDGESDAHVSDHDDADTDLQHEQARVALAVEAEKADSRKTRRQKLRCHLQPESDALEVGTNDAIAGSMPSAHKRARAAPLPCGSSRQNTGIETGHGSSAGTKRKARKHSRRGAADEELAPDNARTRKRAKTSQGLGGEPRATAPSRPQSTGKYATESALKGVLRQLLGDDKAAPASSVPGQAASSAVARSRKAGTQSTEPPMHQSERVAKRQVRRASGETNVVGQEPPRHQRDGTDHADGTTSGGIVTFGLSKSQRGKVTKQRAALQFRQRDSRRKKGPGQRVMQSFKPGALV